jgi:uncharacterized protein
MALPARLSSVTLGTPGPGGGWSGVTLSCDCAARDEVDIAFAATVAAGATRSSLPRMGRR